MRISHTILSIALGCGLNSAVAADSVIDDGYFQTQKPCMFNSVYQNQDSGFMPVRFRRRSEENEPPSIWYLDVSKDGDFCYLSKEDVKLWRPDMSETDTLKIEIQVATDKYEEVAKVRFRRNKDNQEWPEKVELVSGVYMMNIGSAYNKVTVHQVPENEADKAKWMEDQGCTQQAKMYQPKVADKSL